MPSIQFRRFTKPHVLRAIRRDLLDQFFQRFDEDLSTIAGWPHPAMPQDQYCRALAAALMTPERLPDSLNEALFAIDEMATPEGQERLETALADARLSISARPDASRAEIALQAWLAAPELVARRHNEQRMLRLTRFEYFRARVPSPKSSLLAPPSGQALQALAAGLDAWFNRHHRGEETARVELYPLQNEFWFLVRHGDTFMRAPAVERHRTEIIHYRPERDDLVVYSPPHDEVRIHARTRGERELYRQHFGQLLHGDSDYFADRLAYTLEPLRQQGQDALRSDGLEGISKITLRELEVFSDNGNDHYEVHGATDLFARGEFAERAIPLAGRLTRAVFEFQFLGCPRKRPVQISPPNVLKLGRHCDARTVDDFFCQRGFRIRQEAA
jgi:hypothetical protein